ncbi:MAG: hypothetical protein KC431_23640, partial [Myxococcales bacterium]|nr:hypothetical protein [Myxococcales bacterium]
MPPKPETVDAILETVLPNGFARLDRGHGEIARGGMASIERVVDRSLGRQVALKLLRDELQSMPLAVRSFVREAQVMGQLDHPNIV